MPEGHVIHRLAREFERSIRGRRVQADSPQGRFAQGAALLDALELRDAQAHGKHLFLAFAAPGEDDVRHWLRVHLGLYGSWTFERAPGGGGPHAIGAPRVPVGAGPGTQAGPTDGVEPANPGGGADDGIPTLHTFDGVRVRVGEEEHVVDGPTSAGPTSNGPTDTPAASPGPSATALPTVDGSRGGHYPGLAWQPLPPRPTVRLRLVTEDLCADLTGPAACEVITEQEKAAVEARLGPDPLRRDHREYGAQRFKEAVQSRRKHIGELLMDQSIVAGVGNIYRAEVLYRQRLDPFTPGTAVSTRKAHAIWRDLVVLLRDGFDHGRIVTTNEADRPHGADVGPISRAAERADPREADQRWYVYHRTGRPCLRCGATVREQTVAGRRLFWCPRCQRPRR